MLVIRKLFVIEYDAQHKLSANITIHVIFKEKSQHAVLAFKHAETVELEAAV